MDNKNDSHIEGVRYVVVVNDEEQHAIWPDGMDVPLGWKKLDNNGSKDECLKYINEHWTDMRPLSLRKNIAQ
jgi:MbtH protein